MKYFKLSSNLDNLRYNYKFPMLALDKDKMEVLYKNDFKVLEYIKSDKTQCIDLDLKLFDMDNINFDLDLKFELGTSSGDDYMDNNTNDTVFNANDESGSPWPGLVIRASGSSVNYYNTLYTQAKEPFTMMNGSQATSKSGKYFEYYNEHREATGWPYVHYINHFEFTQSQRHTFPTTLFSSLTASLEPQRFIEARVFHCYIKQNGQYVRYLTPVQNTRGINGMYDHVSGRFFTTICGNNFIAGPEIQIV